MRSTHPRSRSDVAQTATLVARSFAGHYDALSDMFTLDQRGDPGARPEYWRVIRRRGRIVAHVGIYDKPVRIGRAVLRMGGLGFVCCDPAWRRRGFAGTCVKDALAVMRNAGIQLSFLFGISRYYDRFGYVGCFPAFTLKIAVNELRELRNPFRLAACSPRDVPALAALYNAAAAATPASVVRDAARTRYALKRWKLLEKAKDGRAPLLLFRERKPRGAVRAYLVWRDNLFWEAGMRPGDEQACAAVLAWLRDKRRETLEKEVVLQNFCPAHPLWAYAERFNHTCERSLNWVGGGMGCIVDVSAFLAAMQPEFEARVRAAAHDGPARAILRVGGRTHTFSVKPVGAACGGELAARVACTPQALLQMVLGTLPYQVIPGVKTDGSPALLRALFPVSTPAVYRLDGF